MIPKSEREKEGRRGRDTNMRTGRGTGMRTGRMDK